MFELKVGRYYLLFWISVDMVEVFKIQIGNKRHEPRSAEQQAFEDRIYLLKYYRDEALKKALKEEETSASIKSAIKVKAETQIRIVEDENPIKRGE